MHLTLPLGMRAEEVLTPITLDPPQSVTERKVRRAEARALIERCQNGDTAAFSELYDRFSGLLLAMSHRILRSTSAAEEVLQETFLYAWQNAGAYDPSRSSVSTWLVMIARSRSIDRLRRNQHEERLRNRTRAEASHSIAPIGDATVLDGQRRSRVRAALSRLSSEQRMVVDLAYYGGLSQKQIAKRMRIPLGTVKTRTHLAYRKLRRALASDVDQLISSRN